MLSKSSERCSERRSGRLAKERGPGRCGDIAHPCAAGQAGLLRRRSTGLGAIVAEVPLDEAAYALLDRRRRTVTDVTHQVIDVGERVGYVALLQRQQIL